MAPPGGSHFGERLFSFLQKIIVPSKPLGDLWEGSGASNAHRKGDLRTSQNGKPLRIAFRNLSPVPLLLCWIADNGELRHFYELSPSLSSSVIDDSKNEVQVSLGDHIEHTVGGHAFCFAYVPEDQIEEVRKSKSLKDNSKFIVGGYRAFEKCEANSIHLVSIRRRAVEESCCQPGFLRKRKLTKVESSDQSEESPLSEEDWLVQAKLAEVEPTPYDTTKKFYERKLLGGWPCYLEPDWNNGDKNLEKQLAQDLENAAKFLPDHARNYLQTNCPIWVNKSIQYGPQVCPVRARGCCYHPGKEWLRENGLCEDKHLCVEINCAPSYTNDLSLWGPGGVMLHELSHAFHHRMLPGGYGNKEIKECYKSAMKEGLYDCVRVHGAQGPETKAYACSNCMEYFAEL